MVECFIYLPRAHAGFIYIACAVCSVHAMCLHRLQFFISQPVSLHPHSITVRYTDLVSSWIADVHHLPLSWSCWSVTLNLLLFSSRCTATMIRLDILPWIVLTFARNGSKWLGLFPSLFSITCYQLVHLCMTLLFLGPRPHWCLPGSFSISLGELLLCAIPQQRG